jgi:hypothetical protein
MDELQVAKVRYENPKHLKGYPLGIQGYRCPLNTIVSHLHQFSSNSRHVSSGSGRENKIGEQGGGMARTRQRK